MQHLWCYIQSHIHQEANNAYATREARWGFACCNELIESVIRRRVDGLLQRWVRRTRLGTVGTYNKVRKQSKINKCLCTGTCLFVRIMLSLLTQS